MIIVITIAILVLVLVLVRTRAAEFRATSVCEKNTPPKKKTLGTIGSSNTKSGAGEQIMLLSCRAKARV